MDQKWSCQTISRSAELHRWINSISEVGHLFDKAKSQDRTFHGEIAARKIGDIGLLNFRSTGHSLERIEKTSRISSMDYLLVSLQLDGEAQLHQKNRSISVGGGSGAIGLVDASQPFRLTFPRDVHRIFVFVPRARFGVNMPLLKNLVPISLNSENSFVDILRSYMRSFANPDSQIDDLNTSILLDGFVSTLMAAAILKYEASRGAKADYSRRQLALHEAIDRHLSNPNLSPELIGKDLAISVRLVHKLLEGSGTTFGTLVRNKRLEACARALRIGNNATAISAIAYLAGFKDLSHFNRSFKARFGVTPTAWRNGAVVATSSQPELLALARLYEPGQ